jgi:N-dimethylarginine dimethylaminohydrolase
VSKLINQTMLVSSADYFALDQPINPYYDQKPVNVARAKLDHQNIVKAFQNAGINIIRVPAPSTSQDGVYCANWALVRGERAVLARLPNARKTEEAHAQTILENRGINVKLVPENYKYSGQGDSLICGPYLLAGSGYRSDPEAQQFAARELGLELVQLHTLPELDAAGQPVINQASGWPDSFFYDLDLAISVLRDDLIAYCPDAFDEVSRAKIAALPMEKIAVSLDEAKTGFACNLVSTGETVVMSPRASKLRAAIEAHGLKTLTPDVEELFRGGGFIRCVSLTLD